jgi:hypothetical protein
MVTSCIAGPADTTDPALLALEFEAIIAANYPPSAGRVLRRPPAARCATAVRVEPPGDSSGRNTAGGRGIRTLHRRPDARQRSPPVRTPVPSTDPERRPTSTWFRPDPSSPRREPATPIRFASVTRTSFLGRCPCPRRTTARASRDATLG